MSGNTVTRRHTHRLNGIGAGEERCPWCGSEISRTEFERIRRGIEADEKARLAKVEQTLRATFNAEIAKAKRDAVAREAAIRKEATAAANAVLAPKIAEAISSTRTEWFTEKLKLTEQLQDMQRRLEKKTAHDRGEPAELDLFQAVRMALPEQDTVSRVARGVKGADVVIEVVHGGSVIGKIIVDSKAHARWSRKFTTKLRADQLAADADFAVLSSSVFPVGAQQLHLVDGVIIADPARVPVLVVLLRSQILENHILRLGAADREEKAGRLYEFITSRACSDLLDRIMRVTSDLHELDRTETTAHQRTWTKRADLIRLIQSAHSEFSAAVAGIIAGEHQ